jgi:hypothetical protein
MYPGIGIVKRNPLQSKVVLVCSGLPMGRRPKKARTSINFDTAEITKPFSADEVLSENATKISEEISSDRKAIFYTEKNGEIVWDEMRPSAKESLRDFYMRNDVRKNLGITEEKSVEDSSEFGKDEADGLLDLLQPVLAIGASKVYNVSYDITSKAYVFDDAQRKKINPRLIRLLNKWGPSIFKQYKDEIGCGVVLISAVAAQTKMMKFMDAQEKKKKQVVTMPQSAPRPSVQEKSEATGD